MNHTDTIAAIATAPGEGGIAIVRVAGPQALVLADEVFRGRGSPPSQRPPFTFAYGSICDPQGSRIDDVLLLIMRAPRSYTGEDQIEIQGHGGPVACRRILRRVLDAGARLAEPGEFTRRAFLNNRLDLIQAEAVLDLIKARSERAAQAAVDQLEGRISSSIETIYNDTISINADLEATLDFPEDELPPAVMLDLLRRLDEIQQRTEALLATWADGHLLRDGALMVIAGRPNVGKSTLMNVLLGRDRAIVSDTPGTTRDTLEESYLLHGIPLRLVDTAGLRDAHCEVEREGIRRSREHLRKADATLYLLDAVEGLTAVDSDQLAALPPEKTLVIWNKMDLVCGPARPVLPIAKDRPTLRELHLSLKEENAATILRAALGDLLHTHYHQGAEQQAVIAERHRDLLEKFLNQVQRAHACVTTGHEDQIPLASQHLREALEGLGTATGRVYHQELLDSIFSRFCIGK